MFVQHTSGNTGMADRTNYRVVDEKGVERNTTITEERLVKAVVESNKQVRNSAGAYFALSLLSIIFAIRDLTEGPVWLGILMLLFAGLFAKDWYVAWNYNKKDVVIVDD